MEKSILIIAILLMVSCGKEKASSQAQVQNDTVNTVSIKKDHILVTEPLTAEEQAKLKPIDVINRLKQGNKDFVEDNLTVRNTTERVRNASLGQFPKAVVLSCLDSRVPVEDVFHSGLGNLFVARVAGNIVNDDILGSLEYSCKVSGARVVVVLGHEYCGAVISAIKNVKLGNITTLLDKIQPAIATAKKDFKGQAKADNEEFVEAVCDANVYHSIAEIRERSPILKEMEKKGEIIICGAVYNMKTGRVEFLK
ncbi:carbonic anhydrase [Flavobacterium sp. 90]|uniref:carbonic anhydrase family protein n=1 Tax=unclassified Flavobacterium TaxID=196869 RepID=UPI000F0DC437|nr:MULTISPECIES: carbonic anhydrase family protein [unclassified Flavobacterium]RKR05664.1 carbonic anhydrase [Flavobacterium sp. 81]TCK56977.1 carbonic anhydrase [Flavobacterium sp. 90]